MALRAKPKYYLVEAGVLPEVFIKVTEARELLETGEVRTVAEAVERVGISRSAFYKYKDSVMPFRDMRQGSIVTFNALLRDRKGVLSALLAILPTRARIFSRLIRASRQTARRWSPSPR